MKKLFLFLFLTGTLNGFTQTVIKYRAESIQTKVFDDKKDEWPAWTEAVASDALIVFYISEQRMKIFTPEEMVFDLIESSDLKTEEDKTQTATYTSINADGKTVYITQRFLKQ